MANITSPVGIKSTPSNHKADEGFKINDILNSLKERLNSFVVNYLSFPPFVTTAPKESLEGRLVVAVVHEDKPEDSHRENMHARIDEINHLTEILVRRPVVSINDHVFNPETFICNLGEFSNRLTALKQRNMTNLISNELASCEMSLENAEIVKSQAANLLKDQEALKKEIQELDPSLDISNVFSESKNTIEKSMIVLNRCIYNLEAMKIECEKALASEL